MQGDNRIVQSRVQTGGSAEGGASLGSSANEAQRTNAMHWGVQARWKVLDHPSGVQEREVTMRSNILHFWFRWATSEPWGMRRAWVRDQNSRCCVAP